MFLFISCRSLAFMWLHPCLVPESELIHPVWSPMPIYSESPLSSLLPPFSAVPLPLSVLFPPISFIHVILFQSILKQVLNTLYKWLTFIAHSFFDSPCQTQGVLLSPKCLCQMFLEGKLLIFVGHIASHWSIHVENSTVWVIRLRPCNHSSSLGVDRALQILTETICDFGGKCWEGKIASFL